MADFDKPRAQAAVSEAVARLQKDDCFTDLIVRCDDRSFKVHKIIVSASSEWFKTALTSGLKEGSSGEIVLKEDDKDDVAKMIHFCYYLEYGDDSNGAPMALHARMFALGEKYLMPSMEAYAVSNFRASSGEPATALKIADFGAAVQECYSSALDPKRLLKTAILEISIKNASRLFGSSDNDAEFRQMVRELPEYASDVLYETYGDKGKTAAYLNGRR